MSHRIFFPIAETRFEPTWEPVASYADIGGETVMVGFVGCHKTGEIIDEELVMARLL